ncbi:MULTISPECIES: SRPBCC family protein [unclassified Nocardioides]|uniref:SRPBCC family protein n=1 Tax=unclassified Nocardioides TaxID=2615069 RepID=UPI0009EFCAFC|nr:MULTISPECIES: SRPBCC family protein [unclassified Nocardioides]GAW49899.1 uncharacterized protein PD653B2_2226 [Nocardioides sp. PD653-B2]GAW56008.1 uncharacterized protein PD653_3438 [Nocardioides sp. PD653]
MTETFEPVRRGVTVGVDQQRAFDIFTADMTSWWPAEHHIGSAPIEEIVIEPHAGGRWFTRHQDGTQTSTGYVVVHDRPHRLVVTWQIGSDWTYHEDLVTTVEVTFEAEGPERTRVSIEHRDFAAYGDDAETMRKTFDAPDAWASTLAHYAEVADAQP